MLKSDLRFSLQTFWVPIAVLFAVCFAIYGRILHAPFQFDDLGILMRNPNIESIPHFFKNWQALERKAVTFFTFALNYKFGGHDTFGYHVVNVLLHAVTSSILYGIILNLLRTPALARSAVAKEKESFALFAALIFLVHPLQTQSVTYIWQRSELLSGFFYLSAYALYLQGRILKRYVYFAGAAAAAYIGLFAKGTVVSLPVLILLTEFYFFASPHGRKWIGAASVSAAGLFIVSLFWPHPFRVTLEKFGLGFLVRNVEEMKWDYMWTQFKVLMVYIKLSFFPVGQSVDYYFPIVRPYPDGKVALSFLALLAIAVAACRLSKRQPLASFGIAWFFVYLLPTSFLYLLVDLIFEHRVYVSMAGFGIFLAAILFKYVPQIKWRQVVSAGIILGLCTLTVLRNELWRSPVALMEDAIKKGPLNFRPYLNLGTYFYRQGNLERAVYYYEQALALKPYSAELYNNLGLVYRDKGDWEAAWELFEKALSIKPDLVLAMLNLSYVAMDRMRLGDAEEYLERALKIEQSDKVYAAFGFLSFFKRDMAGAKEYFLKAAEYNPGNPRIYFGLGNVYFALREYDAAAAAYQRALVLDSLYPEARVNLARVYLEKGDMENYRRMSQEVRQGR